MKAAQINAYGLVDVVTVNEVEVPVPTESQVLVEVYASSLNPIETKIRDGSVKETMPVAFPATLGGDFAGIVTQVGAAVTGFAVGDKVYGQASILGGNSGALAEFAATAASQVGHMPAGVSFQEAASLPLVGVSALQALTKHINLQSGQKIFIHGGAGGIGSIAVQIAKHIGAYVAATASGENIELVRQLGADEVIDYKAQQFSEVLDGYDAVFDTVGGEDFANALTILKAGGIAVSMTVHVDEATTLQYGVTAISQQTRVTTEMLDALAQLVASKVVAPQVGVVYPLSQIQAAFTARESGAVRGKVVIAIRPE